VLHLRGSQFRALGQQAGQPGQIAAVEDVAAFDFEFELGPAGEPVLAGQRQLRRRQDDPADDRTDARGGFRVTALGSASSATACYVLAEVDSVLPADPAAPSRAWCSSYPCWPNSAQRRMAARSLIPNRWVSQSGGTARGVGLARS
jgi:hypothetical protein